MHLGNFYCIPFRRDQTKQAEQQTRANLFCQVCSGITLDAIKTLRELALFCEHKTGFIGGTISGRNSAPMRVSHSVVNTNSRKQFKPNDTSKKGFEDVLEMVDLTMDDVESVSNATDM